MQNDYNIENFDKALRNITRIINELPDVIGKFVVDELKDNFENGSYFGAVWESTYFAENKVLKKSGNLQNSIKLVSADLYNGILIRSEDIVYNQIHNNGGRIRKTEKMIKFFWAKWYETKNDKWKKLALSKNPYIEIPKREFLNSENDVLTRKIQDKIKQYVQSKINN